MASVNYAHFIENNAITGVKISRDDSKDGSFTKSG